MPLTAFMPGPTYDAFTPGEFMEQAFSQPFSMPETFGQGTIQTVEDMSGIGTVIRSANTAPGRGFVPLDDQSREPPADLSQPQIRQETDAEVAARGDQTLNQDQYKSSPYFRPQIPWDESMTVNRARDLAQYTDLKAVRAEMAQRRPWTAMAATAAGSALDPINYIPVLGEGATALAVGRLGTVTGRALVGAGDAALNVGIAGLLTAPVRAQYGDDISWQSQVSQMAMGAALGAGFGTLGGVFKARADARAEAIRTELDNSLSTIRNGQDAMATLREAVAHLSDDGQIQLGDASLDRLDALQGKMADAAPEMAARVDGVPETPAAYANRVLTETMPDDMQRLSEFDRAIDINTNELASLHQESMDNERFRQTRAGFIEAKQLDEQYQRLQAARDKASSDVQRAQLQSQMDEVQARVQGIFDNLDPATVDRLDELDQAIPLREKVLADARAAREPLGARIEAARQDLQQRYLSEPLPAAAAPAPREGMTEAPALPSAPAATAARPGAVSRSPRQVIGTAAAEERPAPELIKIGKDVGKPATPKAVAEEHGVDLETGSFPEQFELDQLQREGRMTAADREAMQLAETNFKTARAWGDALKVAVACLI